jgi:hypothetical protein
LVMSCACSSQLQMVLLQQMRLLTRVLSGDAVVFRSGPTAVAGRAAL